MVSNINKSKFTFTKWLSRMINRQQYLEWSSNHSIYSPSVNDRQEGRKKVLFACWSVSLTFGCLAYNTWVKNFTKAHYDVFVEGLRREIWGVDGGCAPLATNPEQYSDAASLLIKAQHQEHIYIETFHPTLVRSQTVAFKIVVK